MIETRTEGPVAHVTLNRPQVHNAFDSEMVERIRQAFEDVGRRDSVRVVVLEGRGKSFSAGADLNWMRRMIDFTYEENLADAKHMSDMFSAIAQCPKPVIARVHGATLGGGSGLVAAADIALAVESASFGFTEVRLGIIAAVISPWVVARIGAGRAREYMLTGERFSAATAFGIGLVHSVAPDLPALDRRIHEKIESILSVAPGAIARTKTLIAEVDRRPFEESIEYAAHALAEARTTEEGQFGMAAFLERRPPPWVKK